MTHAWDADAFRHDVQRVLDEFVGEQAARLAPLGDDAARLVEAARAALAGGKRFRAAFCAWGFRAVDAEPADPDALVRAAAALEVLHASASGSAGSASTARNPQAQNAARNRFPPDNAARAASTRRAASSPSGARRTACSSTNPSSTRWTSWRKASASQAAVTARA